MPCVLCNSELHTSDSCRRHGDNLQPDDPAITVVYSNSPSQDVDWMLVLVPSLKHGDIGVFAKRFGEFVPVWDSSPAGKLWHFCSAKSVTVTYGRAQVTLRRGRDTVTGFRNVARIGARLLRGDVVEYALLDFSYLEDTGHYRQLDSSGQVHWFEPVQ